MRSAGFLLPGQKLLIILKHTHLLVSKNLLFYDQEQTSFWNNSIPSNFFAWPCPIIVRSVLTRNNLKIGLKIEVIGPKLALKALEKLGINRVKKDHCVVKKNYSF